MAKQATVTVLTSTNNNTSTLNFNFAALNTALLNTLSLDGSTPNVMLADLDLNSNDLLNVQDVNTQRLLIAGVLVNSVGNLNNWNGEWATTTAYAAYDMVYVTANNTIYRCITAHTAGTFATDLSNGLWEVYIASGLINQASVAITGGTITGITDLAIADGGTGASDAATALTNLGGQTQDDTLDDLAALTLVAGDVLIADATPEINRLAVGSNDDVLQVVAGAPAWVTPDTVVEAIGVACSDETTALTTGTAKVTFRMPYAMTVTDVRATVTTAPTDATLTVDINEGGTSILSTKLTIDSTELTSTTAAAAAVISDSALADDAEITVDIDQIGSTIAGAGLKIWLIGTQT